MLQKRSYIRSEQLLRACRDIPCQHCGRDDGTVCAAHSNIGVHGKGRGIKADDNRVAALCSTCHMDVDQGRSSREDRLKKWWAAHMATVRVLLTLGEWPLGVPVPDLRSFND